MNSIDLPPPSPCNKICVLNSAGTLCTGCFRTMDEIAKWTEYSAEEKWAVLALLAERRKGTSKNSIF